MTSTQTPKAGDRGNVSLEEAWAAFVEAPWVDNYTDTPYIDAARQLALAVLDEAFSWPLSSTSISATTKNARQAKRRLRKRIEDL